MIFFSVNDKPLSGSFSLITVCWSGNESGSMEKFYLHWAWWSRSIQKDGEDLNLALIWLLLTLYMLKPHIYYIFSRAFLIHWIKVTSSPAVIFTLWKLKKIYYIHCVKLTNECDVTLWTTYNVQNLKETCSKMKENVMNRIINVLDIEYEIYFTH